MRCAAVQIDQLINCLLIPVCCNHAINIFLLILSSKIEVSYSIKITQQSITMNIVLRDRGASLYQSFAMSCKICWENRAAWMYTYLYTALLMSALRASVPSMWLWNLLRPSVTVSSSPQRPRRASIKHLRSAVRWSKYGALH